MTTYEEEKCKKMPSETDVAAYAISGWDGLQMFNYKCINTQKS